MWRRSPAIDITETSRCACKTSRREQSRFQSPPSTTCRSFSASRAFAGFWWRTLRSEAAASPIRCIAACPGAVVGILEQTVRRRASAHRFSNRERWKLVPAPALDEGRAVVSQELPARGGGAPSSISLRRRSRPRDRVYGCSRRGGASTGLVGGALAHHLRGASRAHLLIYEGAPVIFLPFCRSRARLTLFSLISSARRSTPYLRFANRLTPIKFGVTVSRSRIVAVSLLSLASSSLIFPPAATHIVTRASAAQVPI